MNTDPAVDTRVLELVKSQLVVAKNAVERGKRLGGWFGEMVCVIIDPNDALGRKVMGDHWGEWQGGNTVMSIISIVEARALLRRWNGIQHSLEIAPLTPWIIVVAFNSVTVMRANLLSIETSTPDPNVPVTQVVDVHIADSVFAASEPESDHAERCRLTEAWAAFLGFAVRKGLLSGSELDSGNLVFLVFDTCDPAMVHYAAARPPNLMQSRRPELGQHMSWTVILRKEAKGLVADDAGLAERVSTHADSGLDVLVRARGAWLFQNLHFPRVKVNQS